MNIYIYSPRGCRHINGMWVRQRKLRRENFKEMQRNCAEKRRENGALGSCQGDREICAENRKKMARTQNRRTCGKAEKLRMKMRRENEENSAQGSSRGDGANCAEKRKKMLQRKCYRQNAEKMARRKIAREGNQGDRNCAEKLGKEGHGVKKMVQGKCRGNSAEKKQSHHRF